jgi:hypothetical protein
MALEAVGKRSAKPLKISILNLKKTEMKIHDNVITIGFGPKMPHTDLEYYNLLAKTVETPTKRVTALRYIKRYLIHSLHPFFFLSVTLFSFLQ